jgi:nicotinamide mononucleotide transporter
MDTGHWIDTLQQQAAATSIWEWIAVVAAIAEVLWARANKVWLYPAGIISICITIILFVNAKLYAESFLNVYYLVMSIYGWVHWIRRRNEPPLQVTHTNKKEWIVASIIIFAGWTLLFLVLKYKTDSTVPVMDAFVSATAWAGMWLLARRKVENWLLLNLSNLVAIPLLFSKGLLLYGLLTIFLFIVAIFGYIEWRKLYKEQQPG